MGTFEVTRTRRTTASPEHLHALVNDFREWRRWSPWENLDPAMERTYTGAQSGVGARYAWKGNKKAGAGTMEIAHSSPDQVIVNVAFTAPFESTNTSTYAFHPLPGGDTEIVWRMTGPQSRLQKILFAALRMNAKVAKDFDQGLAALSAQAESSSPKP